MSKISLLSLTVAIAAGVLLSIPAKAQTQGYGGGSTSSDPFGGAPGMGAASHARKPASSDSNSDSSDTDDPSLTRLKTSDSLGSGSMTRDEGQLTAKVLRREKISNVDTKKLPTSKTDSKFQGSLLQSSVSSISDVGQNSDNGEKPHLNLQNVGAQPKADEGEKENAAPPKDEDDARFKARQLMLNPSGEGQAKTKEARRSKTDSSASPSPSPSVSASPSSR